jgi:hypothetical protein
MKKFLPLILCLLIFVTVAAFTFNGEVPYPEDFRQWTHIKTRLVEKHNQNEGFTHIYANTKAMEGYTTGKFPEGSILIFDVIQASKTDSISNEGKRKHTDVMIKDSVKFASTGGWGYEEFSGDSKKPVLTVQVKTQCFNCHAQQSDYVFSEFRK